MCDYSAIVTAAFPDRVFVFMNKGRGSKISAHYGASVLRQLSNFIFHFHVT
jgi:hypothetical protein